MYHLELDLDLKRNPYKGLYIALEGIDGSGKTTQVKALTRYFEKKGKNVVCTREPRKEGLIADINKKLLDGRVKAPQEAFQYLFTVDRMFNHRDVVEPALKRGDVVITDRCFWSAVAYGQWDMGKDTTDNARLIMICQGILATQVQFIAPDMTFYFAVSVDTAMKRIPGKEEAKEVYEKKDILEKVAKGYDWLRKEFPELFTVLDAEASIDEVTKDMIEKIENIAYRGSTP